MSFLSDFIHRLLTGNPADWPNDRLFDEQWALRRIGWLDAFRQGLPSTANKPIIVAVLDTGVDTTHPDLAGVLLPGASFVLGSNWFEDSDGHGTGMASIIAAKTDNQTGMAGLAFDGVKILPVKVIGNIGGRAMSLAPFVGRPIMARE